MFHDMFESCPEESFVPAMSTAPRAARKGGKKAASPNAAAQVPPAMPLEAIPEIDVKSSDLSGGLLTSFLSAADPAPLTNVAVGVVRGRGHSSGLKEVASVSDRAPVEEKLSAFFNTTRHAINPMPQLSEFEAALKKSVVVTSDACKWNLLMQACKNGSVLVVSPLVSPDDASSIQARLSVDVGLWEGSQHNEAPVVLTSLATFVGYLSAVASNENLAFQFNSIVFANCIVGRKSAVPLFDVAFVALRRLLTKCQCPPSVALLGSVDLFEISTSANPLVCQELTPNRQPTTSFDADECAALCATCVKMPAQSHRGQLTESIHPKLIQHNHEKAREILSLCVAKAAGQLRFVIFTPEVAELEALLKSDGNLSTTLSVKTTLEMEDNDKTSVTILSASISDEIAAQACFDIAIDTGMEKQLVTAPKGEADVHMRIIARSTAHESKAREDVLGWKTHGSFFSLMSPTEVVSQMPEEPRSAFTDCMLTMARYSVPLSILEDSLPSRRSWHAVPQVLQHLSEQCIIASPTELAITFVGEFVARMPLPVEAAMSLLHGIVLGFAECFALVAVATTVHIRTGTSEDWVKRTCGAMKKQIAGQFSDTLSDARVLAEARGLSGERLSELCGASGASVSSVSRALKLYDTVLKELQDYCFLEAFSPTSLQNQLDEHMTLITYSLSASFAQHATVIRTEADYLRNTRAKGNLMFFRSSKEVTSSHFAPSAVEWKVGSVIVPVTLVHTFSKFLTAGVTSIAHNFFHNLLVLLHPSIAFDSINDTTAVFEVTMGSHKSVKRLTTSLQSSVKILNFREKWMSLLGCVQAKRILPQSTQAQLLSALGECNRKLNVAKLRTEVINEMVDLIQEMELTEVQAAHDVQRVHVMAPKRMLGESARAAPAADTEVAARLAGLEAPDVEVECESAFMTVIDDDVEVEGVRNATPIEDDD